MRAQPLKKLFAFNLIAIGIFFFSAAKAQIIYTNVRPDTTIDCSNPPCTSVYNLDLNNDGVIDYTISISHYNVEGTGNCMGQYGIGKSISMEAFPYPDGHNAILEDSDSRPRVMMLNDVISGSATPWFNNTAEMVYPVPFCSYNQKPPHWHLFMGSAGPWQNQTNSYAGLQLTVGKHTYYGWVRLSVGASVIIKDYAYNSVPDSSILAGDEGKVATGISPPENQNQFSVFPNPASDEITFSFSSSGKKEIQITNALWQIVFAEEINSYTKQIDVSQFIPGLYFLNVKTSSQILEGKFLRQ